MKFYDLKRGMRNATGAKSPSNLSSGGINPFFGGGGDKENFCALVKVQKANSAEHLDKNGKKDTPDINSVNVRRERKAFVRPPSQSCLHL